MTKAERVLIEAALAITGHAAAALHARIARLEEALRFYADKATWEKQIKRVLNTHGAHVGHSATCLGWMDQGAKARAALKEKP